jgi:YbbR domain-containing protein
MLRSLIRRINSIIMALLLAVVVWSVATSEANPNPSREGLYPETFPIEIVNVPDGMVIYQRSATTVRLRIRAPQASWDQLTANSIHIQADLQGLGVGLHQVALRFQIADPQVAVVSSEPSAIGVRLEQLKSRQFDIHSDVLDTVPLGFEARAPGVTPSQATVSGAGILVDQVSEVVADVFLRGAKTPVEREVTLIARDSQGNNVQGVTISPATVTVTVQIEQRVGYKDVSIKAVLKGAAASGYWVSNVAVTPSTATIVGSADVLAKIPGYIETMPVDVSGATADVTKRVSLALPDNVSALNNEGATVQVSVTPILGGQTVRRSVVVQGLRRGLVASVSPAQVDVILSGPLPTLQSLSPDDVQVIIDATGLGAGTFQLKPRVPVVPDSLKVGSIVPDSVQIILNDTFTPTATLSLTPQPTSTSSATPLPTPTPTLTPLPSPTPMPTPTTAPTLTPVPTATLVPTLRPTLPLPTGAATGTTIQATQFPISTTLRTATATPR